MVGASGYIGQHVVLNLLEKGLSVICVIRKNSNIGETLKGKYRRQEISLVELNHNQGLEILDDNYPHFDAVISCIGSRTGGIRDSWNSEYLANLYILKLALKRSAKRFVLLSAICVQKPELHFQRAKLAIENELIHSGISYAIIRPTAFFKSLSGQLERVKSGKSFIIFDNGMNNSCKPISECDLAEFLCNSLTNQNQQNKISLIGGSSPAITPLAQAKMLFSLARKNPKFLKIPSDIFKVFQAILTPISYFSSRIRDKIEFLKIAYYYATESMLYWEKESEEYSSVKTPEFGTEDLETFYRQILARGTEDQDLRRHKLF